MLRRANNIESSVPVGVNIKEQLKHHFVMHYINYVHTILWIVALVWIISSTPSSHAASNLSKNHKSEAKFSDFTKRESSNSKSFLKLGLMNETFLQPQNAVSNHYQVLDVTFYSNQSRQYLDSKVNLHGGAAVNNFKGYRYFYAPEVFIETSDQWIGKKHKLTFGRKIQEWSIADHEWELGIIQPRFRWNYFDPQEQGLLGLFYDFKLDGFSMETYASGIYIPEQGPGFDLDDQGSFSSSSPYFKAPSKNVSLISQNSNVNYKINQPSLSSVLFKPLAGMRMRFGSHEKGNGFSSHTSYLYKPMNQISESINGSLSLVNFNAYVDVYPVFYYHHVIAADAAYRAGIWRGWLAAIKEIPIDQNIEQTRTAQKFNSATVRSVGSDFELFINSTQPTIISGSYLNRTGGDAPDQGPFAKTNSTLFESRYPYKSALSASINTPLPVRGGDRFHIGFRSIYELNNQSYAHILKLRFFYNQKLSFHMGGELLGSNESTPTEGFSSDMISRNKANDRLVGGLDYVF